MFKNVKWCKFFGHKWNPVFVKGEYNNIPVKFIGCYCERCRKGYHELLYNCVGKLTKQEYGTYSEKYFDK